MSKTLSIVIPCFNEEEAIPLMIPSLIAVKNELIKRYGFVFVEMIVVNDASTDRSADYLKEFDEVTVITNTINLGYGGALKKGFQKATGDWICFLDMDNSYPVLALPQLFEKAIHTNAEHIVGVRSLKASGMSPVRGFGNWIFSSLTGLLFNMPTSDVCSGFRVFSRKLLPLALSIETNSLGYSLELSIRLSYSSFKTSDLAIDYRPRSGSSKLSVCKDGLNFLFIILQKAITFRLKQKSVSNVE